MALREDSYQFIVENFQGPLDLLLHLIRKEEMDIFNIPILRLIEQYEEFLKKMEELNLTIASEYLYMLSTLLNIKARMLLRGKNEEKEEDIVKPLISKIIEYEKIKKAADELKEKYTIWGGVFGREENGKEQIFLEEINIYQVLEAFQRVLERLKLKKEPPFISSKRPNIKEMMVSLLEYLPKNKKPFPLIDFLLQLKSYIEVITSFIATLELIRIACIKPIIKDGNKEIYLVYLKDIPENTFFEGYI